VLRKRIGGDLPEKFQIWKYDCRKYSLHRKFRAMIEVMGMNIRIGRESFRYKISGFCKQEKKRS
jgi:hypothetical protein